MSRPPRKSPVPNRRGIRFERLEARELFAIDGPAAGTTPEVWWNGPNGTGDYTVQGTNGADNITLTRAGGRIWFNGNNLNFSVQEGLVRSITLNGYAGDDTLSNKMTPSASFLPPNVTIRGGAGNDIITSAGDYDAVYGDGGDDRLEGSTSFDEIYFKDNVLYLNGTDGADRMEFKRNNGRVHPAGWLPLAGTTADLSRTWPTPRRIEVNGRGGDDLIANRSVLVPVIIHGGEGNDALFGVNQWDGLYGDGGSDTLNGSANIDLLATNDGVLYVEGTAGPDAITVAQNDGFILLRTGGKDLLNYAGGSVKWAYKRSVSPDIIERIEVKGLDGDDTITSIATEFGIVARGGNGNDKLTGGAGMDTLYGEAGDDLLYGGAGNDQMVGGTGSDRMSGEAGDDWYVFENASKGLEADAVIEELFGRTQPFPVAYGGRDTLDFQRTSNAVTVDLRINGIVATQTGRTVAANGRALERVFGSSGNDILFAANVGDYLNGLGGVNELHDQRGARFNGSVLLAIPLDTPQIDNSSCGPNSAFRVLQYHGHNVSYVGLMYDKVDSIDSWLVDKFGMGTRPSTVESLMRRNGLSDAKLETDAKFERILQQLEIGRPVVALVNVPGGFHYIAINGYDQRTQRLHYVETTGVGMSISRSEFLQQWNWDLGGLFGWKNQAAYAAGLHPGTIIS